MQSAKTRPGAECGSAPELFIAKFRLKLKKVGKTTRSFRYDLNQILYDYTVEVRNRFKGLDLIECLMNYGQRFMTLYRRQGSRPSPWKRNTKKQNGCLSESEVTQSCPTLSDPGSLVGYSPWNFPGKSPGVGCHFLLQGIIPTQGANPGLLHSNRCFTI